MHVDAPLSQGKTPETYTTFETLILYFSNNFCAYYVTERSRYSEALTSWQNLSLREDIR